MDQSIYDPNPIRWSLHSNAKPGLGQPFSQVKIAFKWRNLGLKKVMAIMPIWSEMKQLKIDEEEASLASL